MKILCMHFFKLFVYQNKKNNQQASVCNQINLRRVKHNFIDIRFEFILYLCTGRNKKEFKYQLKKKTRNFKFLVEPILDPHFFSLLYKSYIFVVVSSFIDEILKKIYFCQFILDSFLFLLKEEMILAWQGRYNREKFHLCIFG